ncbi:hypothetical protein ACSSS7_005875 [Eimeria intestinalis]
MSPPVSSKPPPPPSPAAAAAAAAAVPSIPAATGGAKGRAPRVGASGASPKGRRHEGGEGEEASASEAAAAAVLETIVAAGAEMLHKRAFDRKCFAFAAADAAHTLLSILSLCHLTVDLGEPGDLEGQGHLEGSGGPPTVGAPAPVSPHSAEGGPPLVSGLEGEARSTEEGRLERTTLAPACRWEEPPLPIPGPQDSWAPGCLGIKRLTPELLQQLEIEDKKREQQQAAALKQKPSFSRPAAAATAAAAKPKAAAGGQMRGAKSFPLPRRAAPAAAAAPGAADAAPAASKQGARPLGRIAGVRGPIKEQRGAPQAQRRISSASSLETPNK